MSLLVKADEKRTVKTKGKTSMAEILPFKSGSWLDELPDVVKSSTIPQHLVSPSYRNQRCFRYLDCFDDGVRLVHEASARYRAAQRANTVRHPQTGAVFKAVYLSSQLDRNSNPNAGGL